MSIFGKKIRVRFPPSPTGFVHIGSLRTALYNYLFARKHNGEMILRVEDTDRSRFVPGAMENLIRVMDKMGLAYEEGPVVKEVGGEDAVVGEKGAHGPYIQSKRLEIYKKHADKLLEQGKAYHCFCTPERLQEMREGQMARKEAPRYDRQCLGLSEDEVKEKLESGVPHVIRLKVPDEGKVKFIDLIRGEIEFDCKNIDDQVLMKSDGYPTYHLAIIDDHLMGVTHVIRGEEWISSIPKYVLLYRAFGWEIPQFAHLPLLLNSQKKKLSKREGDVAVEDFLAKGYLPEALVNFVALLGWNPGTDQEIFDLKGLAKSFSLDQVQKSGAVFDPVKLDWINAGYIRKMDVRELAEKCIPYLETAGLVKYYGKHKVMLSIRGEIVDFSYIEKIVALEQERMKKLSDIDEMAAFFFKSRLEYDPGLLVWKKMEKDEVLDNLGLAREVLEGIDESRFTQEAVEKALMPVAERTGVGNLLWPLRVALTGQKGSPGPFEVAGVLGKKICLERIDRAIEMLE